MISRSSGSIKSKLDWPVQIIELKLRVVEDKAEEVLEDKVEELNEEKVEEVVEKKEEEKTQSKGIFSKIKNLFKK